MTVTLANLKISLAIGLAGTQQLGGPFWNGDLSLDQAFSDGVIAGAIDRVYLAERTIGASTNDDIDISNAAFLDGLGVAITPAEIVGIIVMNRRRDPTAAANVSTLTLGGAANPVVGYSAAGIAIKPGGIFVHMNPDATGIVAVTAGTGDIFRVANGAGGSNTYCIAFLLRSA